MSDIETALNNLDAGKYEPSMAGYRDRHTDVELVRETLAGLRAAVRHEADCVESLRAELAELRSSMTFRTSLIGRTEVERDALRAELDALKDQEPAAWFYTTNGAWDCYSKEQPPDDAYDEGSLLPLYARPVPPAPSVPDGWLATLTKIDETLGRAYKTCPIEREAEIIQARIDIKVLADHMTRAAAPKPEGE